MKKTLSFILFALVTVFAVNAQTGFNPVIDNIVRSYTPWYSAEFSGKIKSQKLPVSPTIKIFMVRDSLLQISLRAPLVGEVGRLNLTPQKLTAVNKMNRTYVEEPSEKLLELYPGLIGDLQSLLLARVVILGQGELSNSHAEIVEVDEDREGGWLLIPHVDDNKINFNYGYQIGGNSRTLAMIAGIPDVQLELTYGYRNRGLQIGIDFEKKGKKFEADLDFSTVRWGGKEIQPINLINYRQVSVKEFLNSLK